jgi:predicted RNA-binding protein
MKEKRINIIAIQLPVITKQYGCRLRKYSGTINGRLERERMMLYLLLIVKSNHEIIITDIVDDMNDIKGLSNRCDI